MTGTTRQTARGKTVARRRSAAGQSVAPLTRPAPVVALGWWTRPSAALEAGLLAISAAVPLTLYRGISDTFELPKQAAFRTLLVATLSAAAALAALRVTLARTNGAPPPFVFLTASRSLSRLDLSLPLLGVVLVLGAWLLATALSLAPTISVWGIPSRWGGARTQVAYLTLFLTAMGTIRRPRQLSRLVAVSATVATGIAAYALIQGGLLGWMGIRDPWSWTANVTELTRMDMPTVAVRPSSTFGNPNFLGAYLTITALLTAGRIVEARGRARLGWTATLLVQATALVMTQSRTAWVGAAGGLGALALWTLARRGGPWRRTLAALVVAAAAAGAGLWLLAPSLPSGSLLARAASIVRPTEGTGGIRLVLWRMSLRTWQDRPLTGFGPDMYASVYERHYNLQLQELEGGYTDHNRAENAVIDTLVSTGALGLAALLALGAALARATWRVVKQASAVPLGSGRRGRTGFLPTIPGAAPVAAACALGAYLLTAQTNPEVVGASFMAWLCAGCIAGLALGQAADVSGRAVQSGAAPAGVAGHAARNRARPGGPPWGPLAALGAIALGVTAWYGWTLELPALTARRAFDYGLQAAREDRTAEYADLIAQAARTWPYEPRYWAELGFAHLSVAELRTAAARPAEYAAAMPAIQRAISINPVYPIYKAYLGEIASRVSLAVNDPSMAPVARQAHEQSVTLGPNSWEYWQRWGQTEYRLKNYSAAREKYERSVQLFDKYWVVWTNLGDTAAQSGDRARARQAWQRALSICRESPRPCTDAEREQVQRAINSLGVAP